MGEMKLTISMAAKPRSTSYHAAVSLTATQSPMKRYLYIYIYTYTVFRAFTWPYVVYNIRCVCVYLFTNYIYYIYVCVGACKRSFKRHKHRAENAFRHECLVYKASRFTPHANRGLRPQPQLPFSDGSGRE